MRLVAAGAAGVAATLVWLAMRMSRELLALKAQLASLTDRTILARELLLVQQQQICVLEDNQQEQKTLKG